MPKDEGLPITGWHHRMLSTCGDPDCSDNFHEHMLISWAVQITPTADERRLNRAFDKLCKRHDILRLSFKKKNGSWQSKIADTHPTGLLVQSCGEVSDAEFQDKINAIGNEKISIFSASMIEMHLVKFIGRGDVLIMKIHHAISDGFGVVVLIEDLIKYLLNMPILSKAVSHKDYISKWALIGDNFEDPTVPFWENEILPIQEPVNFGRAAKNLPPLDQMHSSTTVGGKIPLSKSQLNSVNALATQRGLTLFNYVFASFAEMICMEADAEEVYITTIVGRNDHRLDTYAGFHTNLVVLKYQRDPSRDLHASARYVADKLAQGIANLPTTAMRRGGKIDHALAQKKMHFLQYVVHIPFAVARGKRSMFANGLMAKPGSVQRVGPVTLRDIPIQKLALSDAELKVNMNEDSSGYNLTFAADDGAFNNKNLKDLGLKLKDILLN